MNAANVFNASKTPDVVVTEIKMSRTGGSRGSFFIVEGEHDSRFWRSRIQQNQCELVIANSKRTVLKVVERLELERFGGILGQVDSDHDHLLGRTMASAHLVYTDTHDLETLLLRSSALERLLAEHGDPEKIRRLEQTQGCGVRAALLARGLCFGRLRWASMCYGWELSFDKLHPARFIEKADWRVKEADLLSACTAQLPTIRSEQIQAAVEALPAADPWQVCQGHDLVDILNIGLQAVLGQTLLGRGRLASLLRVGLDHHELSQTELCR